jgi:hypothetical protein
LGVKQGDLDAIEMDEGRYFSSMSVENKKDKLCSEIINVYGKPIVVCGDFNIVRYCHGKSSRGVHSIWMDMFNGFIEGTTLIEIKRLGSTFT